MSPQLPPDRVRRVEGFGFRSWAYGYVYRPTSDSEVREVFDIARDTGRKVVLRGAGRSYGDASIAAEQVVLDIQAMNEILNWDPMTGIIECESGATIEHLWRHCLPDGWWPPVVPGTMAPTIAGALAMNIHGKNNFNAGTLGQHVEWMDVFFPNGSTSRLTKTDPDFANIISSAGLLGVIVRAAIRMKKVQSGGLDVFPVSCANWDGQFKGFEQNADSADYMVSWIDCFAKGSKAGRGQFHAARYVQGDPGTLQPEHQDLPSKILGIYPKSKVWRILKRLNNRPGMRLLNSLKHLGGKMSKKERRQSLVAFSFLLDYVPNWRNAYLPSGFIQYQSFVPKDAAREVFAKQIEMAHAERLEPFLGVMKRHRPDQLPFLFAHAIDGYSLALDFKVTEGTWLQLQALCHRMNDLVLEAGGRFYFAKDSTLRPEDLRTYLGNETIDRYNEAKSRLDPGNLLTTQLAERVALTGSADTPVGATS